MKALAQVYLFILGFAVVLSVSATDRKTSEMNVAVGWHKPPYVDQSNSSGFEIELVSGVFARMNISPNFVYIPYGRSYDALEMNAFDAVMTLSQKVPFSAGTLSNVYIFYQNVAVSLSYRDLNIQSNDELAEYSVVGFQNARRVLTPSFSAMAEKNANYLELPEQARQVQLLIDKRVDVIVLDVNIFKYFWMKQTGQTSIQGASIHRLFPANGYRMGFVDENRKDAFNQALTEYLHSAKYFELMSKYRVYLTD